MTWTRRVKCEKCSHAFEVEFEKEQNITEYLKKNSCRKCGGVLQAELDENLL